MSITDRDAVHALCEHYMGVLMDAAQYLLDQGVGPFFGTAGHERIAPPLHGPKDFWDFNVKYDKPINDLLHENDGRMHVHCHGSLSKCFDGFLEAGTDVLHPVEPPPMGDLPAAEAKRRAGDRLCIEGNIQIAHMYEHTPAEVAAETAALIEAAFDDHKNLIVSTTASPWIRGAGEEAFPQYKAMVETVINWRN
jgi:uroporphyrinogen-III decarboxylase